MTPLASYFFALMVWLSPIAAAVEHTKEPAAVETVEARADRYRGIAVALDEVVSDPAERSVFQGPDGRARTGVLLLALSWMESGFRADVDHGVGPAARGGAADSCLMQVRIGSGRTGEGWNHEDLTTDRTKCFRAGLHLVRQSYGACRGLPPEQRLTAYAAGTCSSRPGQEKSKARIAVARRLLAHAAPPAGVEPATFTTTSPTP